MGSVEDFEGTPSCPVGLECSGRNGLYNVIDGEGMEVTEGVV